MCNTQIPSQEDCCCSPVEGSPRIEASITLTAMPMPDWRWRLAAFDIRLSKRIGLRAAMDYDPTFLVRPVFPDLTPDAEGRVHLQSASNERQRQDHLRLSIGMVWHIR